MTTVVSPLPRSASAQETLPAGDAVRRAAIVTRRDPYANSVKPRHLRALLEEVGFEVDECDTVGLGRFSTGRLGRMLPRPTIASMALFVCEALRGMILALHARRPSRSTRVLNGYLLALVLPLRGRVLRRRLAPESYEVVICDTGFDEAVFRGPRIAALQILDMPSPFIEEQFFGGFITARTHLRNQVLEAECYAAADRVGFHWRSYEDYVRDRYYDGSNWLSCGYGVEPKVTRSRFSSSPRIVFLGNLDGYWVNVPLLVELCRLYPALDVWGGPDPGPGSGLNYRGYAPALDVLAEYQFGLITITSDPLRKSSFSSKHLEYASYGLPVLTPAWRTDALLAPSSIAYTPETFLEVLSQASTEAAWTEKSESSLRLAEECSWGAALGDLEGLVRGL